MQLNNAIAIKKGSQNGTGSGSLSRCLSFAGFMFSLPVAIYSCIKSPK